MKLTPKQSRFVAEYLIDLNATQAAIRAGYSQKTAQRIGSENLSKLLVQNAIAAALQDQEKRTRITADQTLHETACIAFSDIRKIYDGNGHLKKIEDIEADTRVAIASIETTRNIVDGRVGEVTKIRLWNKLDALGKLGKHFKLFTDRMELTGKEGKPVQLETGLSPEAEQKLMELIGSH